jgi:hypothetical protein
VLDRPERVRRDQRLGPYEPCSDALAPFVRNALPPPEKQPIREGLPSWSVLSDALFAPIPVGHHARPLLGSEPSAQKSVQSP